ncbi:NAD-dependent deacetylase sirtuin-2 [Suhomyces tanzawaensis NRRL Y-17324]|uniref:NAD-dependent protein deacetylase n=1 Tax=Suhomyces tanzawaensis NRRL Y-17324 TaxID=984487 RepID=A0A1E4SRS9_9ASCO|nr:NAD-dependent deacetylase sirtuin-2 [Suhomyces tanzawaensis NRRL Y-17324]ODV82208.1 NAD-dependent deacetylase sirtuin-2 [Suhomyces tanzawaensis NRRL Y-17324]
MTASKLAPLVNAIKENKKVTFFTGAGTSTSAGIPDFRSPKTGLYANLAKLNLPYAEAVFDIDYFRENPGAFYTLASELYPGNFPPTKFHYLIRLLQDKKLLKRVYTQNIDTLERLAGVDEDYLVEAHGSFAKNHCIDCSEAMSTDELKKQMNNKEVNKGIPTCAKCKGLVKPDIVFFGEGLPERFFKLWAEEADDVEIAIVAGTSLTVYPFASLPGEVDKKALRVLVNNELVGAFKAKKRKSDIWVKECDKFAEDLCAELGWSDQLEALVKQTKDVSEEKEPVQDDQKQKATPLSSGEEAEKIAQEIDSELEEYTDALESLDEEVSKLKI